MGHRVRHSRRRGEEGYRKRIPGEGVKTIYRVRHNVETTHDIAVDRKNGHKAAMARWPARLRA